MAVSMLVRGSAATRSMCNVWICLYRCETPLGILHKVLGSPANGTWNCRGKSGGGHGVA